jgi:diguanylate cyclase (GGDEF)-like protein
MFPSAFIAGTSTNGDICDGHLWESGMVLSVSVFESSLVKVYFLDCGDNREKVAGMTIRDILDADVNIKAGEILVTVHSLDNRIIINEVEKHKRKVCIWGGGSANEDVIGKDTIVFDGDNISHCGVVFITYAGDALHIAVKHAIGWKPLGKDFSVTKIDGNHLYELDNVPAGRVYKKYLDIQADEDFFSNILEFPIMAHQHGYDVLRLPYYCDASDDSIELAAALDEGTPVNLSYGDPDVIRQDVCKLKNEVENFAPEAIFLYSCGVRRLYWKYLINKETAPFANIAPVAGFYSFGEIMGMGDYIIEHHVTLIAISMREGGKARMNPTGVGEVELPRTPEQAMHSPISMVRRLANYINVTTAELHEANEMLKESAETDELTGIYNRRMLNKIVSDAMERANKHDIPMLLGIVDIDDFKKINDTYGHDVGDSVLKTLTHAMALEMEKLPSGIVGRWGGEEFLFLAPHLEIDKVLERIEMARERISQLEIAKVGCCTISVGVTQFIKGDTSDTIFKRADDALLEAKGTGKNKLCIR